MASHLASARGTAYNVPMMTSSVLLVAATVAVFVVNVVLSGRGVLAPGYGQMIHAEFPVLLLLPAIFGLGLGIVAFARRRSWLRVGIVAVETTVVAFLLFLFGAMTALPSHRLTVSVGDPFPAYSLVDQDGVAHTFAAGTPRAAALYVFYRGDW